MAANGFEEPAYLSQSPNARGARNFFMSGIQRHTMRRDEDRRGNPAGHVSTATPTCCRAGREGARADRVRPRLQGMIDEFAIRHPRTGKVVDVQDEEGGRQVRPRNAGPKGSRPLRPVRANPFLGRQRELESVLDEANRDATVHQPIVDAMESAIKGEDGRGRGS
jgi:hypothetical protein